MTTCLQAYLKKTSQLWKNMLGYLSYDDLMILAYKLMVTVITPQDIMNTIWHENNTEV